LVLRRFGRFTTAIRDVESELLAMKAQHDPFASLIFVSRRHYRNVIDTKSGKHREMMARLSLNTACELGFRGASTNGSASWEQLRVSEDKLGRCIAVRQSKPVAIGLCLIRQSSASPIAYVHCVRFAAPQRPNGNAPEIRSMPRCEGDVYHCVLIQL
jgi:hypothetical protein